MVHGLLIVFPVVITSFDYTLPNDVDYIVALLVVTVKKFLHHCKLI
jgi:hypothetical protein